MIASFVTAVGIPLGYFFLGVMVYPVIREVISHFARSGYFFLGFIPLEKLNNEIAYCVVLVYCMMWFATYLSAFAEEIELSSNLTPEHILFCAVRWAVALIVWFLLTLASPSFLFSGLLTFSDVPVVFIRILVVLVFLGTWSSGLNYPTVALNRVREHRILEMI